MGNRDPRTTLEFLVQESNENLKSIEAALSGGGSGTLRTPSIVNAVSAGSTTSGVKGVSLTVISDDATIGGVSVPNGYIASFNSDGADTVDSIAYDPGTGNIIINYLA